MTGGTATGHCLLRVRPNSARGSSSSSKPVQEVRPEPRKAHWVQGGNPDPHLLGGQGLVQEDCGHQREAPMAGKVSSAALP
eukprot:6105027-Prorocentrum_lima.AAC.1